MRWLWMTILLFGLGCAAPMQKPMRSTEPYVFLFSGTVDEFDIAIKRLLIAQGFSIGTADKTAGVLITEPKTLMKDESNQSLIGNAIIGVQVEEEKGIVSFIFEPSGNDIIARMKCALQTREMRTSILVANKRSRETNEVIMKQGDKLPMKLKAAILQDTRFRVNNSNTQ